MGKNDLRRQWMPLIIANAGCSDTQKRHVVAGEDFFFFALEVAVCSGGSGTNLHFASWVGRRWWKHEFAGIIFPVVSVTSYRPLLFGAPGSCPAGSFLNPVLVNGVAKWCPCQEKCFVLALHKLEVFFVNVQRPFRYYLQNLEILASRSFYERWLRQ